MSKSLKKLLMLFIAIAMCINPLAACKKSLNLDTESVPLRFGISGLDGVFSPYFSTTGNDSEIVGLTQIGMLSSDPSGKPTFGENEPTVVLDMTTTMKDKYGKVTQTGDKEGTTEYKFLLKNDIKFSDGASLTIKDVLFNLYVYLDPVYTGSATLYSTDIQGLAAYRTQNPNATDADESANENTFSTQAVTRIQAMIDYANYLGGVAHSTAPDNSAIEGLWDDIEVFNALFEEEMDLDYRGAGESLASYRDEYNFKEDYQLFFYLWSILPLKTDSQGYYEKQNGKYLMDPEQAADLDAKIAEAEADYADFKKDGFTDDMAKAAARKAYALSVIREEYTITEDSYTVSRAKSFANNLRYTASYMQLVDEFKADQRSKYYKDLLGEDGLKVPSISGIDGTKVTKTFNGVNYDKDHELLAITINGVDPKAIWNFAFSVSPMHYYSDLYASANKTDKFGVEYCSTDFMKSMKRGNRISVPVGAGPYKASTWQGATGAAINGSDFYKLNVVYFERNEFFETVGKGVKNAKIKYLRYQQINTDQIVNALKQNEIDFGSPNAKTEIIDEINSVKTLDSATILTNGYGYVGINPKFVESIWERRAIMKAMNPDIIINNYYSGGLGERINRPMSSTSWAYPEGVGIFKGTYYGATSSGTYLDYTFDSTGDEILTMLKDQGYSQKKVNGKNVINNPDGKAIKYTFTIAGETEDHPAWAMFKLAEEVLESIGFDIVVKKDATALTQLASGNLAVWAAAWSSTIDPDMFQVYHKESRATSVNNWGYKQIYDDSTSKFATERAIIDKLSAVIDEARTKTDQESREIDYSEALDLVMELAVEMPTYQRNDLTAYNKQRIKESSLTPKSERTPLNGLVSKIWEIDYN